MIRLRGTIAIVALLMGSAPALAHMPFQGIGGFYGGLLHPVLVPAHALSLVALGLLIGQQSDRRIVSIIFTLALAAGLIAIALAIEETPAGNVLLGNACRTLAARSLPVPLSPVSSTVDAGLVATFFSSAFTALTIGPSPTIRSKL